jgi:hypothetical protein
VFIRECNSCKTDVHIIVDIGGHYITLHYFLSFIQEQRASTKDLQRILFWAYATRRKVEGSRPDVVKYFFSIYFILPAALSPGIYSASNRNEYQKKKYTSGE